MRHFKLLFFVFLIFLVISCAHKMKVEPNYTGLNKPKSEYIIEKAIMQQKEKYRPASVLFYDKYMSIVKNGTMETNSGGVIMPSGNVALSAARSKSTFKDNSKRIYYNSIKNIELYSKKSYFIIVVTHSIFTYKIYVYDKAQAYTVFNAFNYLVDKADQ